MYPSPGNPRSDSHISALFPHSVPVHSPSDEVSGTTADPDETGSAIRQHLPQRAIESISVIAGPRNHRSRCTARPTSDRVYGGDDWLWPACADTIQGVQALLESHVFTFGNCSRSVIGRKSSLIPANIGPSVRCVDVGRGSSTPTRCPSR